MLVFGSNLVMEIDAYRRKRLQALIDDESGGNVEAFARTHNQSAPRLRQMLSPTYRDGNGFKERAARRLESELGLSKLYFDLGFEREVMAQQHTSVTDDRSIIAPKRGQSGTWMAEDGDTLDEQELPHPTEDEFAFVPQLDIAAACGNGRFEDHVVVKGGLAFKKSFLREQGVPEQSARIIYSSGGSMAPTVQDGRVVLLNLSQRDPIDTKIFAICLPDGGLVLKRLIRDYHPAAGAIVWILRSDNPDKTQFPDKILPPDDRTIIVGRAVWTDNLL